MTEYKEENEQQPFEQEEIVDELDDELSEADGLDEELDEEFAEDFDDDDELDEVIDQGHNSAVDEISEDDADDVQGVETTMEGVVEAILFASDEPLNEQRLVSIVETGSIKQIRECINNLNDKYEDGNCAFRIEQIAGGYQMMTLGEYNHWLKKLLRVRTDTKLSPAALETLAIVAYKQPIIRADVEVIRGVAAGEVLRNLMYKGLVKIIGRAEVLGRPMLYGTTKKFLDVFGLNKLKDLPKIEELKRPEQ